MNGGRLRALLSMRALGHRPNRRRPASGRLRAPRRERALRQLQWFARRPPAARPRAAALRQRALRRCGRRPFPSANSVREHRPQGVAALQRRATPLRREARRNEASAF
jgi:hypothetical protein